MDKRRKARDCEIIQLEIVDKVRIQMPAKQKLKQLANLYKVFSDHTRIQLLWALERNEMCVCDLAVLLNMTKSAISHQLKVLRLAKLVMSRRKGKNIYYSLTDDHVKDILWHGLGHVNE